MEAGKILIVDDEANIRRGLKAILTKDGHDVRDVASAEEALQLLQSFMCEVAVVDIRMSGISGVELLHEIRERWPIISVILLTGHGTLETAMAAVKEGAHDYLLKPAQPDEIRETVFSALAISRRQREEIQLFNSLRSSLQRLEELPASPAPAPEIPASTKIRRQIIKVGGLRIDLLAHEVRLAEEFISLSPSEFQLLVVLANRLGEVIDYVTLVELALDYEAKSWEAKELIKRHIFSLRQKIEPEPASPRYILNVRGVGYRLVSPENLS